MFYLEPNLTEASYDVVTLVLIQVSLERLPFSLMNIHGSGVGVLSFHSGPFPVPASGRLLLGKAHLLLRPDKTHKTQ